MPFKGMNLPGYSAQYAHEYHQIRRFHPGYSAQTGEIDKRIFYKKALPSTYTKPPFYWYLLANSAKQRDLSEGRSLVFRQHFLDAVIMYL